MPLGDLGTVPQGARFLWQPWADGAPEAWCSSNVVPTLLLSPVFSDNVVPALLPWRQQVVDVVVGIGGSAATLGRRCCLS
jgi:hypothetical protein